MGQEELFKDDSNAWQTGTRTSFFSTKQWTLGLDKIILLLIVTMVFFVLSYSFGFERGRRSMDEKMKELTKQIETLPALSEAQSPAPGQVTQALPYDTLPALAKPETATSPQAIDAQNGKYTIQLATVLQKDKAEDQLKKLEKQGMSVFMLVRGKYYEICVGSYATVSSAKGPLSQIRSEGRFSDAFIRPLPAA